MNSRKMWVTDRVANPNKVRISKNTPPQYKCEKCNLFKEFCNTKPLKCHDLCQVKINSQLKLIKMKNLTISFMMAFLFLTFSPMPMKAITVSTIGIAEPTKTAEQAQAEVLITRLNDIKEMDKSSLTRGEKKELRQETRAIKKNLKDIGQGVYLSAGAIIIIILLLILLL
jgi:hypothetical protein